MELRPDQMTKLTRQIKAGRGGFFDDPGVGKTPPACVWMYFLWSKLFTRTVWAMPSHLMYKNRRELMLWSSFRESDVVIVDGTRAQRDALMESDAKVFITTFAGLVGSQSGAPEWEKYRKLHSDFNAVVLDEPHKYFSNHESASTTELYRCMRRVKYFLPMTGTIVKGRLDSAFPMINIIEPKYYGNYQDFVNQHAIRDINMKVIGWRDHEKLGNVLERIGSRTSFEEIYGKRDIVYFIEEVEMSAKQQRVYDEFKIFGLAELDTMLMEGSNEGVNLLRLRQIMAHPNKISLPIERDELGKPTKYGVNCIDPELTPRDNIIKAHLEDHLRTGEPVVIVSTLIPEQEKLHALALSIGLKSAIINSNTPNKVRSDIDLQFQAGQLQCVVGSPSTMGTGFNWSHLDHIIFAQLDFSADDFIQMLMRGFRGKRTKPLRATLVQYVNSVDQQIDGILDKKSMESHIIDPTYLLLELSPGHRNSAENVFSN